jgi:hypothetical protein
MGFALYEIILRVQSACTEAIVNQHDCALH